MSNTSKSSKKSSDQKHQKSVNPKTNTQMSLRTKDGVKPTKSDDEFYFSPILLVGLFITALGAGFLVPGASGLNAPAFETWSIIIPGVIISIVGAVHQFKHNQMKKAKNVK